MMINEPKRYVNELAKVRMHGPARCIKCGRFVGNSNLGGRNDKRSFICIDCTEKYEIERAK